MVYTSMLYRGLTFFFQTDNLIYQSIPFLIVVVALLIDLFLSPGAELRLSKGRDHRGDREGHLHHRLPSHTGKILFFVKGFGTRIIMHHLPLEDFSHFSAKGLRYLLSFFSLCCAFPISFSRSHIFS